MGYYSLYKIVKDILRTVFGSKFLRILFILIIILFCSFIYNKVFAFESSTYFNLPITEGESLTSSNGYSLSTIVTTSDEYNIYNMFTPVSLTDADGMTAFTIICKKGDRLSVVPSRYSSSSNYMQLTISATNGVNVTSSSTDFSRWNRIINYTINNNATTPLSLEPSVTKVVYINQNVYNAFYPDGLLFSSNFDGVLYDLNNNIVEDISTFNPPRFDNTTEIENGYPDGVYISRGSYSKNDYLYFHLLQISYTVPINDGNDTVYYYNDKTFALNKDSKYFKLWESDPEDTQNYSYYYISRSALGLDTNSSYLYVLSNSGLQISNTVNILQEDVTNGFYDVIQSDTTGVITPQDSTNDKIQNIDDTLSDNTVSSDTETNIEDSLSFDNNNSDLNNMNTGFFSAITSIFSNLVTYDLGEDTTIVIPLPHSNNTIVLHSNVVYNYVSSVLKNIITAFWYYVFGMYLFRFINRIYIALSSGSIMEKFDNPNEVITSNML